MNQINLNQTNQNRIRCNVLLLLVAIFTAGATYAQVSIGTAEAPVSGALLQLKEMEQVEDGSLNAYKGLLLPRVALSDKNELYPMFLADPDDPTSGPNDDYAANKDVLDNTHIGLVVYNLTDDESKGLTPGLNQWNGEQWDCFQHKIGNAVGHIVSCNDFRIFGNYKSPDAYPSNPLSGEVPLNASNYITIRIEVTKPGEYVITVTPEYASAQNGETNGYFFTGNGIFLEKGVYTVTLTGNGTPFWYTPNGSQGDKLSVVMNGKALTLYNGASCTKNIVVEDHSKKSNYTIDCLRTTVNGVYVLNKELDPNECYLSVWIEIDPNDTFVEGATVHLQTDEVDGISFASVPTVISSVDRATGQKEIILRGTGKPTSVDTKKMTISSNSAVSVATCPAEIAVAYTKKKILGVGLNNGYGYNLAGGSGNLNMSNPYYNGGYKMLKSPVNFGTAITSTVKVEGLEFIDATGDGYTTPTAASLRNYIDANKPDIIVIGYDYMPSNAAVDVLIDYLSKKGVVIAAMENTAAVERLFNRALNLPAGTVDARENYGGAGSIHMFKYMANDDILNGPFGDIRERPWGEDASATVGVVGVPLGMVDIYSDGNYNGGSTVTGNSAVTACRFKDTNLVWIGDGGFWSRAKNSSDVSSRTICPLYYDNDFRPVVGLFSAVYTTNIYNSFFFANMMAWAMKTAQFNGYNTP
ncbi:MAG: hypothetical protein LBH80_07455 [Prevotellaceae bacterium]|jgi:hypothetical protein|nr:hypothetical protein [Prevotellaceae bacterium]